MAALFALRAACGDEFGPNPTWQPVSPPEVRQQVVGWLAEQSLEDSARGEIESLWPAEADQAAPDELLDRVAETAARCDDRVRALVDLCAEPNSRPALPEFVWLAGDELPQWLRGNLRLYYARWLAQHDLYDEALAYLTDVAVEDVVDPASLLFYRSVAYHRIVSTQESRQALARLLEREAELPHRYRQLAQLMSADLKEVKDDSLDHIARRMDDIRRRLDLGRAGQKVRDIEDGVIASLDKLIKQLEDQAQQQQAASSSSGGANPSSPMQDSMPGGGRGPGDVERRDVGRQAGWGDLPPKQREEALQQIGKEFPSHFRDAIEQYFRKIASEESGGE